MHRREFLVSSALATGALWFGGGLAGCRAQPESRELTVLLRGLLQEWGGALLRHQLNEPGNSARHGAIVCPGCGFIHGRCFEAVRPLLQLAAQTGDAKYREAALRLFEWSANLDVADGAWLNDLDPKAWKGTTVFGVIAVAQSLRHHGTQLDTAIRGRWRERLRRAAEFVAREIDLRYGNINYGCSALLALTLAGRVCDEPKFRARATELAAGLPEFFSTPNALLVGEGRPADKRSAKNCLPVDLAYNVEESLPALIEYAQLEGDDALFQGVIVSARRHLEFMLPDGAWDNSWGTRSYKWTYWGGRTSGGCQAGFLRLAAQHPVFATAALRNARLLRECTKDGVLCGGPHTRSRLPTPCIHHTMSRAGAFVGALELGAALDGFEASTPLPREMARGVREFAEIDTRLIACGPWRATISGYDWLYNPRAIHATGGMLALLWHSRAGAIFAASQAEYRLIEPKNMADTFAHALPQTPRIEIERGSRRYSSLFALDATLRSREEGDVIIVEADTRAALQPGHTDPLPPQRFTIEYRFTAEALRIRVTPDAALNGVPWSLVLPVIALLEKNGRRIDERTVSMLAVTITATAPLTADELADGNTQFNHVPGFGTLPFRIGSSGAEPVECTITVAG